MSATIIQFVEAKARVIAKRTLKPQMDFNKSMTGTTPFVNDNSESYKQIHQLLFDQEYKKLVNSYHTKRSEFMSPSILSGYRRGINPTDALYNNLQEILFKYDKNEEFCVWVVGLFKNIEWTDRLCAALKRDQEAISKFQEDNFDPYYGVGDQEIIELEKIKNKFAHYAEVFKLMKSWEEH